MTLVLVALGGALGAPLRFFTDRALGARGASVFPWGTFTVNVLGSFVLGAVVGAGLSPGVTALVGAGFCGALTTYSTFSLETYRLIRDGSFLLAAANVAGSLAAGLLAAVLGFWAGAAV